MGLFSSKKDTPREVSILDKPLKCHHCGNSTFLIKSSTAFYRYELFQKRATIFICSSCAHMHWFASEYNATPY